MDDQAVRLNRIENKLDKLAEAMTMIARVDEKLTAVNARTDRLEFRLDEYEDRPWITLKALLVTTRRA